MSNNVKKYKHTKPHILLFDDIININNFDPNNIKTE